MNAKTESSPNNLARIAQGQIVGPKVVVVVGGTRDHYREKVEELRRDNLVEHGQHPIHVVSHRDIPRIQALRLSAEQIVRLESVDPDIEDVLRTRIRL